MTQALEKVWAAVLYATLIISLWWGTNRFIHRTWVIKWGHICKIWMKQGYWSRIARLGFCFVLFFVNHQESGYAHENVLGKFSGYKFNSKVINLLFKFHLPVQFSSVQSLSHVQLFATPWTAARQASCPSPTPRACSLMSIESVIPFNGKRRALFYILGSVWLWNQKDLSSNISLPAH